VEIGVNGAPLLEAALGQLQESRFVVYGFVEEALGVRFVGCARQAGRRGSWDDRGVPSLEQRRLA
jgi:hypothetical protein